MYFSVGENFVWFFFEVFSWDFGDNIIGVYNLIC